MVNLETKSIEIQNHMHDSVTRDFDRVSDFNNNGTTLLQGQQDEQPEGVNRAENADHPRYPSGFIIPYFIIN